MTQPYDVRPAMLALADIVRSAMTPFIQGQPTLQLVYDDIPTIFSDTVPFMFFEYRGGPNAPDSYDNDGGAQSSTRTWKVDVFVPQCLSSETNTADMMTKAFVGPFIDLVRNHSTLNGLVDQAYVGDDAVQPLQFNGPKGPLYLANMFTVEITEFVE